MSEEWVPLAKRMGWTHEYDALHENIPPWLRDSISTLLESVLAPRVGGVAMDKVEWLRRLQRLCHLGSPRLDDMLALMREEPADRFLTVLDAVLATLPFAREDMAEALEAILSEGGSAWRVVMRDGRASLERRLDEGVQATAETTMQGEGSAPRLLREAWHEMYGRDPDPSEAYRDAVRAVEAAAGPVITPKDPKPTLGKMIAALGDAPEKWSVALSATGAVPTEVVRDMMNLLWQAQHDRHGSPDEDRPLDVSPEEAEAAVHLAAVLVHWFRSSAIKRN